MGQGWAMKPPRGAGASPACDYPAFFMLSLAEDPKRLLQFIHPPRCGAGGAAQTGTNTPGCSCFVVQPVLPAHFSADRTQRAQHRAAVGRGMSDKGMIEAQLFYPALHTAFCALQCLPVVVKTERDRVRHMRTH